MIKIGSVLNKFLEDISDLDLEYLNKYLRYDFLLYDSLLHTCLNFFIRIYQNIEMYNLNFLIAKKNLGFLQPKTRIDFLRRFEELVKESEKNPGKVLFSVIVVCF